VDVARLGKDSTAIFLWENLTVKKIIELRQYTIDRTLSVINQLKAEYKIENKNIVIDQDGVGGGLVDLLKGCYGFTNNSRALDGENYQNLKTQMYYKLAKLTNEGKIKILPPPHLEVKNKLIQELQFVKADNIDKDGKLQIMSKDKIKKEISRSPDFSDAFMLRMIFTYSNFGTCEYLVKVGSANNSFKSELREVRKGWDKQF